MGNYPPLGKRSLGRRADERVSIDSKSVGSIANAFSVTRCSWLPCSTSTSLACGAASRIDSNTVTTPVCSSGHTPWSRGRPGQNSPCPRSAEYRSWHTPVERAHPIGGVDKPPTGAGQTRRDSGTGAGGATCCRRSAYALGRRNPRRGHTLLASGGNCTSADGPGNRAWPTMDARHPLRQGAE